MPSTATPFSPPRRPRSVTDMKGWIYGITLGYNWQWANWVLGVEGDLAQLRLVCTVGFHW